MGLPPAHRGCRTSGKVHAVELVHQTTHGQCCGCLNATFSTFLRSVRNGSIFHSTRTELDSNVGLVLTIMLIHSET